MAAVAGTQGGFQVLPKLLFRPLPENSAQSNGTPPSHDISSAGYHVTQKALLVQLDHAVKACWTSRHRSKYADVKVLMLSWGSDDLKVDEEISVLMSVFRDAYHYDDIQHWKIPDKRPGHEASARIAKFLEQGGDPDNLLIVYYAGHAMPNTNHRGLPIWFANRRPNSPKFNSSMIQDYLCEVDDYSPDVLFLYDTCHSANGHGSIESSRSAIALLAACGFETRAAEVGRHSFTNALIQELSEAAMHQRAISVPQLHSSLLNRLHLQRQDVLLQEKGGSMCIRTTKDGIPLFEHPVWRTPIYIQLSQNTRPRPIILAPLPGKSTSTNGPGFIDLNAQSTSTGTLPQPEKAQMHVLLRISLSEDSFNVEEFKDWICTAPEPAKEIKIIHTLPSCSTLLLLQMPVEMWDMLLPSPAISFVGFVTVDESNSPPGSTPDTIKPQSGNSAQDSVADADVAITNPSPMPLQQLKKGVTFASGTDDEKSVVAMLDCVDSLLPSLFREIRQGAIRDDMPGELWIVECVKRELEQIADLPTAAVGLGLSVFHKNETLIRNYIGARYLIEHDNPVLNLTWRLNPLFSWRNYDAEVPDEQATILSDSVSVSRRSDPRMAASIFSEARTVDTSLTSVTIPSITGRIGNQLRRIRNHLRANVAGSRSTSVDRQEGISTTSVYRDKNDDDAGSHRRESSNWGDYPVADNVEHAAARPRAYGTKGLYDQHNDRQPGTDQDDEHYGVADPYSRPPTVEMGYQIRQSPDQPISSREYNQAAWVDRGYFPPEIPAKPIFYEDNTITSLLGEAHGKAHAAGVPTTTMALGALKQQEIYQPHNSYDSQETGDAHDATFSQAYDARLLHEHPTSHYYQAYFRNNVIIETGMSEEIAAPEPRTPTAETVRATEAKEEPYLDARFKIEPSHKFTPGAVFKVLWSEPQEQQHKSSFTDRVGVAESSNETFYVGFRRFLVVANDEGHCTCVPILTYMRQGCRKKGVKASEHGIVHDARTKPRLVKGEPELGFRPIRMTITATDEMMARESRVNYSKLVTVEHNVRVFFIGKILAEDFDEVVPLAIDKCWTRKVRKRQRTKKDGRPFEEEDALVIS